MGSDNGIACRQNDGSYHRGPYDDFSMKYIAGTKLTCSSLPINAPSDSSLQGCYAAPQGGEGTGLMCKFSCNSGTCLGGSY